jgi:tRNA (guanine-N7-)-methyltransferase
MGSPNYAEQSVRILLDDWINPADFSSLFDDPAHPLEVDVGCGKGRFLLARAQAHPQINYLGIDRMLRRIRKVDRKAVRRGLFNLRVLRMDAYYAVAFLMPAGAISVYYVFFPDPWPKKRHHANRLFDTAFMDALYRTMTDDGVLHFATDHRPYYNEVCALMEADERFESIAPLVPAPEEQTDFERYYIQQKPIGRASYRKM